MHQEPPFLSNKRKRREATSSNKDIFFSFLRHPLTTLAVGFILSAIVGGLITRHYEEAQERQRSKEKRIAVIEQYVSNFAKLLISAENLDSALAAQDKTSIKPALTEYIKNRNTWKIQVLTTPFFEAKTIPEKMFVNLSAIVDRGSVAESIVAIDTCIKARAYEPESIKITEGSLECPFARYGNRKAGNTLSKRINHAKDCLIATEITLSNISNTEFDTPDGISDNSENALDKMSSICGQPEMFPNHYIEDGEYK